MDVVKTGRFISKLRKEAGYTQKSLAEALFVSDKAVSKWERGICMPDSSLLTKLSMLLDVDIEYLISGNMPYGENKWYGVIKCNDIIHNVGGKPLLHYLISYLMLAGIREISIITDDKEYVRSFDWSQYGITVSVNSDISNKRAMVIYDKFLLFGANITRYFHSFLSNDNDVIPILDDAELPILFTDKPQFDLDWHKEKSERKTMGRGITFIPLRTDEEREDASHFIRIYEKYHKKYIADLQEIARNRGLV